LIQLAHISFYLQNVERLAVPTVGRSLFGDRRTVERWCNSGTARRGGCRGLREMTLRELTGK